MNVHSYSVLNLGCKVNRVESDLFERIFCEHSCEKVSTESADIVVVNTCTVTGEAEKKTRKLVRSVVRTNPSASIVVTGCASAIAPDAFKQMSDRVIVVPKGEIESYLEETLNIDGTDLGDRIGVVDRLDVIDSVNLDVQTDAVDRIDTADSCAITRSRLGVKIQDGCNNECSYCIVCKARGKSISVDHDKVVKQVQYLLDQGVKEILLTGIDLGAYLDGDLKLSDLLDILLKCNLRDSVEADGELPARYRISSIEPRSITDELLDVIQKSNGRICRHLHIPLQSGSDKVLSEMDRHYDSKEYMNLIDRIKQKLSDISITTDIIVGFPGETEKDFEDTKKVARYCGFSNIHVFPYSRRDGTKAALRDDQVDPEIKVARASELRKFAAQLRREDALSRKGKTEIYCVQADGNMMSESYYEIKAPKDAPVGKLVEFGFSWD